MKILFFIILTTTLLSCKYSTKKQLQIDKLKTDWITKDSIRLIIEENNLLFENSYYDFCQFFGKYKINTDTLSIIREGRHSSDSRCKTSVFKIIELTTDKLILKNLDYNKSDKHSKELLIFEKNSKLKNSELISNLEFTATICFGDCPIFDLKIDEDSLLILKGYKYVKNCGLYEKKLNKIEFQRLNTLFNRIDLSNLKMESPCPDASSHIFYIKSKSKRTYEGHGIYAVSNYDLNYFFRYLIFIVETFDLKLSDKKDVKFRDKFNSEFMKE